MKTANRFKRREDGKLTRRRDEDREPKRSRDRHDDRGGGSRFKYKKRDPSTVRSRANQSGGSFDVCFRPDIPVFSPKVGNSYTIRYVQPFWEGAESYTYEVWQHSGVGPDNQRYLCPAIMKQEECPCCEETLALKRYGDKESGEASYKLKAKKRQAGYVIVRGEEDKGPQIWAPSWTVDRQVSALCTNKRTGAVLYLDDPEEGFDLEFECVKKGDYPELIGMAVARQSTPLSDDDDQSEEWLAFCKENPIPEVLVFQSQERMAKVLGGGKAKEEDEEEERGPRTRHRNEEEEDDRPSRRRSSRDEEDDEDEEEEERPRVKKRKVIDDEDEDLDEDDDEEEEERPRVKKRKRLDD